MKEKKEMLRVEGIRNNGQLPVETQRVDSLFLTSDQLQYILLMDGAKRLLLISMLEFWLSSSCPGVV